VRIRAVVIDDEDAIRNLISEILEMRGYEVSAYSEPLFCPIYSVDGECLCPVEHLCTDILIADIYMPRMTGLEFIKHLKSSGCKVQNLALMSGRWTDENIEHAKRLGCHMFKKPFNFGEIEKWLIECEKKRP